MAPSFDVRTSSVYCSLGLSACSNSRSSSAVAIHLYESLGFVTTGVRRGYYTDNREDALIMWRTVEERTTA